MTSTILPTVDNYTTVTPHNQNYLSANCTLHWRRSQLLVKASHGIKQPHLRSLDNEKLLVNCLKHSPVQLVSIDSELGETTLNLWAEACYQAHKPIFLKVPVNSQLSKVINQPPKWLWQVIDWVIAVVLVILFSPLILGLLSWIKLSSPRYLFTYQWRVGNRGKLFRRFKFSTTNQHQIKPLASWLQKSGLDKLPQLWNVLRGEMSLIGAPSWTLEEALRLSYVQQHDLNTLPLITARWGGETEAQLIPSDS